jgi:hypothetical protein
LVNKDANPIRRDGFKRVYTHLLPSSSDRTRKAVDRVLAGEVDGNEHDPQTDDADGSADGL